RHRRRIGLDAGPRPGLRRTRGRARQPDRDRRPGRPRDMTIDPVTLTVIEKGLQQVCSEMDLVHEKTSFSPVISESFDRSNGIYSKEDGAVIAQGELGLPIFIGVMQETTRNVIAERHDLE